MWKLLSFALLFALQATAAHAESPAHCYYFTTSNTPAMEHAAPSRTERWCYQAVSAPVEGLYIYNGDGPGVRPELAAIKEKSGVVTHGSLVAGKVTMHSLMSPALNPLPVPLHEPTNQSLAAPPVAAGFAESAALVLEKLLRARSAAPAVIAITEGITKAETTSKPWRGYWWPNKGTPLATPFTKYEGYVTSRTGAAPGTLAWEKTNHADHGLWWEGHCNGWAASAILRAEPAAASVDDQSNQSFSVSDQKGLLAEDDFCANAVMWGDRFDGTGPNPSPVKPDDFHKVLSYYIGTLGKPVPMNYRPDAVVDNHVISGYTFDIKGTGPNAFSVTATLKVHRYDAARVEAPGVAPSYSRVYHYSLTTDSSGTPIGGKWVGANPGFIWVPLGPGRCEYGNPFLDEDFILSITNESPATRR
jgi:hypothetical protein